MKEELKEMELHQIAEIISNDWKPVHYTAKPYLDAMHGLRNITDNHGHDSGSSIVCYFLSNANTWKGETARAIKAELNKRLNGK